jgi:hypothetical protein
VADTLDQIAKMIAWDEYGAIEDSWVDAHQCRTSYGCCGAGKEIDRDALQKCIASALREARADALREAAEEAFTAGWVAAERLEDNEWGPSPAKDPESAFADWLRARALIAKVSQ